ncbi:EAL domain-containing protein [Bradyrhizobium sp. U87765 SZCCT0131]|uniref:putative bifunctional diguanylate cyclase/phosphodiesterase n=1 Tax=unclassified Bradyrhizobium TaxID=2631580 RepID=UPI001BA9BF60|nr:MULTISPECIES: EAL domain-containing protein [unclassified Bradyrhizobium]MBR1222363.1 EAL domain-containing protein [Bradyrhizobium sp. U87765 SZCCT0131]MBR1264153.1 EAL domain-containing protein [Bradyrhizobium sp. U87765 SZCCT0134]MBR1308064.1 EAL domain-containing protein [Bradyrhizobium sp. U87765 SZCCT0110]MBR1320403.1 EAL domain-containing protein [Bradyrhizobium sp. U87765 SZCCT0109]MBR1348484.1 EAL domain-containing protein [Bradyrhizobium sp. U87765 SZCCT0048]
MFRVFASVAPDHPGAQLGLAVVVGLLASAAIIALFRRAQASSATAQTIWLGAAAMAGGCGFWIAHATAMPVYLSGVLSATDPAFAAMSLMLVIAALGIALGLVLRSEAQVNVVIGGLVLGGGITVMHYTALSALELPGHMSSPASLGVLALMLASGLGCVALAFAARGRDIFRSIAATAFLAAAIAAHQVTAMHTMVFVADPVLAGVASPLSGTSLSIAIATAVMASLCLVALISDGRAKAKLRHQEMLLHAALQNMSQGLCMLDADGRVTVYNERYARLTNVPGVPLKGRLLLDLFRMRKAAGDFAGDPEEFFARIMTDMRAGISSVKITEHNNGRVVRIVEQPMEGGGWVATLEDITEARKAQAQLAFMAHHDALTGLANRNSFREALERAVGGLREGCEVAILCLDLDRFKEINDTLGHHVGDELLKQVGGRLSGCARGSAQVARLGGDEFAIVQVGAGPQPTEAAILARDVVEAISAPFEIGGHQLNIGVSIGITLAPSDGEDPEQLLRNADLALYRAKEDGRGTFLFFEPGMDARAQARRMLELELKTALSRGEFEVYYQPIVGFETGQIVGFEALVRWNHPIRGLIAPGQFIPVAEETGLIRAIGDLVLHKACQDAAGWSQKVCVAVNLSPVQFKNADLVGSVIAALEAANLPAERLELEITETLLLQDSDATFATLRQLRDLGVRISIDDFGTGYSCLSYLRRFPFDKIKIDRSFVQDLDERADAMAIVRAVTGLGRSLGITTTAEGVETRTQLNLLRAEGCTEVQGYLFSPPRPGSEVEWMLSNRSARATA